MADPLRAEIWMADLDPTRGHEQAGKRPVLVVSADDYNTGRAGLLVILPITSKGKGIRSHIPVEPAATGLKTKSFIISDQPRTISKERIGKRIGQVPPAIIDQIEHVLRILLQL